MGKVLSIIIPSYNTESFMEKNIYTMIQEDIIDRLEILIINDGSKDGTLSVANKLRKLYPDSIRVIDKPNGGHGSVINRGIKEATGVYLKIIDGDDYVDSHELCRFVTTLNNIDADCVLSSYNTVSAITGEIKLQIPFEKNEVIIPNRIYNIDRILPYITATIHAVTYKTELLRKNYESIKVLERVFYEDMEFVTYPLVFADSVYISDTVVYQYLIDQANQSISLSNHRNRVGDSIKGVHAMIAHYNEWEKSISPEKNRYVINRINERVKGIYRLIISFPKDISKHKKDLLAFDLQLRNDSKIIYQESSRDLIIRALRISSFLAYRPLNLILKRD